MTLLILGGSGRLGSELVRMLGRDVKAPSSADLDLSRLDQISRSLDSIAPRMIINAAAYTNVDAAEKDRERAMILNAEVPRVLAEWSALRRIPMFHVSTDYVFPGEGAAPWSERSETRPINFYGVTKQQGERAVQGAEGDHLIIRTAWLFGRRGDSFLRRILQSASGSNKIEVVSDQIGSPTFTEDLAHAIVGLIRFRSDRGAIPTNILHLANSGWARRDEFASAAVAVASEFRLLRENPTIVGVGSNEVHTPAQRPLDSRLDCTAAREMMGISLPTWNAALRRCLEGYRF